MYGYCSAEFNLIWIKFYLKRNRSWAARHARPVPLREGRPRWPGREGRTRRKRRFRRRRIFFRRQRIFIRQRTRWQGSSHFFIPPTFHPFETENFTSVKPKTTIYANLSKFMQMSVFESVDTWLSTSSMFTFFHLEKKRNSIHHEHLADAPVDGQRHLLRSRRFGQTLRPNASLDRVEPKRLSIELGKSYRLMYQNMKFDGKHVSGSLNRSSAVVCSRVHVIYYL